MAHHVELQVSAKTDTGLVRPHNEDSIAYDLDSGLMLLADGMGGYNAGEIASAIATAVLKERLPLQLRNCDGNAKLNHGKNVQQLMIDAVVTANTAILEAARKEPSYSGMGTTLVAALFSRDRLTIAHVGDSRAYRLRRGTLTQITRDHSLLQEQIDAGLVDPEKARFSPHRNLITRALGADADVDVEIHDHQIETDDLYLLCSDGLSDMLSTWEIAEILETKGRNLEWTCEELVTRANKNGGRDNTSVILIRVMQNRVATRRLAERLLNWIGDKAKMR